MAVQLTMILIVFAEKSQKSSLTLPICTLLSAVSKSVLAFAWMFELTAELMSPEHILFTVVLLLRLPMVELLTPGRARARTDLAEVKNLTAVVTARLVVMVPMKVSQVFSINQYGSY